MYIHSLWPKKTVCMLPQCHIIVRFSPRICKVSATFSINIPLCFCTPILFHILLWLIYILLLVYYDIYTPQMKPTGAMIHKSLREDEDPSCVPHGSSLLWGFLRSFTLNTSGHRIKPPSCPQLPHPLVNPLATFTAPPSTGKPLSHPHSHLHSFPIHW